jgi:hypothetical protein
LSGPIWPDSPVLVGLGIKAVGEELKKRILACSAEAATQTLRAVNEMLQVTPATFEEPGNQREQTSKKKRSPVA